MKLLFNKSSNGADELRNLTGSYYANNDFAKIATDVLLESEKIQELVGEAIYTRAADHYHTDRYQAGDATPTELLNDDLVQHLQLPIALMAVNAYYQANLVSHEDDGRKVKIDEGNEKMAWEWMLDRDDEANIRKAFKTQDRLIRFLDKNDFDEWKDSDQKKATRSLFINSTEAFNDIFPIDNSQRFFYASLSLNREVQRELIRKALGNQYAPLLQYFRDPPAEPDDTLENLLNLVKLAIPINVVILAVKRFPVKLLPGEIVQQFKSDGQARSASSPASQSTLQAFLANLQADAALALNNLKKALQTDPAAGQYQMLPNNDPCNKYMRT